MIITGLNSYGSGWGWDKVRDIINALAAYQAKPLLTGTDMAALRENGEALRDDSRFCHIAAWEFAGEAPPRRHSEPLTYTTLTPTARSYR